MIENIKIIRHPRCRRLRLAVDWRGQARLTAPMRASERSIKEFASKHLDWVKKQISKIESKPVPLLRQGSHKEFIIAKAQAFILIKERLEHFNRAYGFKYSKVVIRDQSSRWGSCSRKGNLNFNYRVIKLPVRLSDYVIVHELCHLGEFNHSRRFWDLVARTLPDYGQLDRSLDMV